MPSAIDATKVDALLERAHREVDEGLLPSVQIAVMVILVARGGPHM
jgi:hypothetical protein